MVGQEIYYNTNKDGKWKIIIEHSGIAVHILEIPSLAYIENLPPNVDIPEPRDYLAEIDGLRADIEGLKSQISILKTLSNQAHTDK